MKKFLSILLLAITLLAAPFLFATGTQNPNCSLFQAEAAAQQHCPSDRVVWVNTKSGVYHFKGQRWYANTKAGAYLCQKEAQACAYRPTLNGQ